MRNYCNQLKSRSPYYSYLVLLCSQPDTVRRHLSRKTQTSTSLTKGSQTKTPLGPAITPAIADCRYRAPLTPRLRGFSSITKYEYHVKNFPALRSAKNCFIIPLHSSSRTPFVTSTLWLKPSMLRRFMTEPAHPAFGFMHPITTSGIRA